MESQEFVVILFYKFIHIPDPQAVLVSQRQKCEEIGLLGRLLIGEEGINGTFEGTREQVEAYKAFMKTGPLFADIKIKESPGNGKAFPKLAIKVRKEVVTLGTPGQFDIAKETAEQLPAEELQKWYENGEDFVVLDLRNNYEIASGQFEKTVHPDMANFRELPEKLKSVENLKNKKVVAVCTGDIRCEKATCLLKKEGFTNLYQLKDGIHDYMQKYPGQHFKGTLFVFDNRMTTDVVAIPNKEVIGKCFFCGATTETYYSDDSVRPSVKVLSCDNCYAQNASRLRKAVTAKGE